MSAKAIVVAATSLFCLAACSPHDQPTSTNENAAPPVSDPVLDGGAPVTITPGADAMYPVTPPVGSDSTQPPPVVTPEQNSGPPATP